MDEEELEAQKAAQEEQAQRQAEEEEAEQEAAQALVRVANCFRCWQCWGGSEEDFVRDFCFHPIPINPCWNNEQLNILPKALLFHHFKAPAVCSVVSLTSADASHFFLSPPSTG